MLTRRVFRFKALPQKGDDLCYWVKSMLEEMIRYGYAIDDEHLVTLNEDRSVVTMHVVFTGKDAWEHYQASKPKNALPRNFASEAGTLDDRREVQQLCSESPEVGEFKTMARGSVPFCKCKGNDFPLIVWTTPRSGCPPLVCPKDSVLPVYKFGIPDGLWLELKRWEYVTRTLASVWLELAPDGSPLETLKSSIKSELKTKDGWIAREGSLIASKLQKLLKRPVSCPIPAVDMYRL